MNLRVSFPASCPHSGLLLLGLLLLQTVIALPRVSQPEDSAGEDEDLRCLCVKATSQVHLKRISSLEVIRASQHCPTLQLIATLKNGRKICLDPNTLPYKKIIKKIFESSHLPA